MRNWNGKIWIDIREFYVKDGKTLPGKKGELFSSFPMSLLPLVLVLTRMCFCSSLSFLYCFVKFLLYYAQHKNG